MKLNKFKVKYKQAGDKKQKTVFAYSEKEAKNEVLEFMNMFNIKDVKVNLVTKVNDGREGVGNPKFYKSN